MSVTKIESLEALEKVVKESSKVVVADFWATWCKPCELMNPEMETLAEDMKDDIEVVAIDVEALKDVALKYDIQGIPTLICFKNGKEKDRIAGYKPAAVVEGLIRSIIK